MEKPMIKRDSLAHAVNGGPIEWARFHSEHRDLASLNDWRMARRNVSGVNMRDFLIKCAFFYAVQHDWRIDQFADEVGISITTATEINRRLSSIYPLIGGLYPPKVHRAPTSAKTLSTKQESYLDKLLKRANQCEQNRST